MSFAVVEFLHEEAVEVVHKSWIVKDDIGTYCYWPPKTGASAKVRREEMPDKEKWKSYEIRIFSFAETYTKALEQAKRAEDTSTIETDFEGLERRATKRPAKFGFSEDEEADDEDDYDLETCHASAVAVLPQAPQHDEVNAPPSISSSHTKPSLYKKSFTSDGFATSSQESSPKVPRKLQEKHVFNKGTSSDGPHDAASSSGSADPGPKRPAAASEAEHADRPLRTILAQLMTRMKSVDENVQMLLNIQQSRESREDVEDVLPAPVSSPEELADLCTKLADKSFKNKLTQYLSSLGGHSLGDTVRRIFRKLGTNSVWSAYSLKGKKRKQAFADLPLCKVIIRACLKTYAKAKISEVETEISEALKHAPKRKGGSRYKEPEPKRRQTSVQESSDSDD